MNQAGFQTEVTETVPANATAKGHLISTDATVHCNETGLPVEKKLHRTHVPSTEQATYLEVHLKRGQQALDEIDILPLRQRIICPRWVRPLQTVPGRRTRVM